MTTHVHMRKMLLLITFIFSIFSLTTISAQVIQYQKNIGGSNSDVLNEVQPTADGGSIAIGYSFSGISGDKTDALVPSTTTSTTDVWVVKLDGTGAIQWQKNIGGDNYDSGESIKQTTDGGYIIAANSLSNISGDKTENSYGSLDFWLIKLDATGTILWQKTIGGNQLDEAKNIQLTTDGGFIIGGYSNSSISGNKTDNCLGFDDYFVVKLDNSGNIQWQKTIGSDGYDNLNELKQTADGGYILGGFTFEGLYPNVNFPRYGAHDYYVVKIDAIGTFQWQKVYGGSSDDYVESLQQTTDGGYILGGYSTSNISGTITENSNGGSNGDYWLVKIDAVGSVQWQNTIGGSSLDYLSSVQQTQDGGYILGGYSYSSISGDKMENSKGSGDYWLVKTNDVGSIQWQKTIGGSGAEFLTSLQQLPDGSYLLGGYSASNISGDKTENSQGGNDYWVMKLSDPGATNTPSVSDVYYCPNQTAVPLIVMGQNLLWYTTATGGIGSTIAPTPTTTTSGTTTYYVSQTINSVESPRVAISSVIKTLPSVTITGLGTMCTGTSQNIMAYAGTAFVWNDGVTTSQRTITPSVSTTYTVTVTGVNGCQNSGSRTFIVNPPPVASIAGANSICNGTSTTLTASSGNNGLYYAYRWSTGQTTAAITVAPTVTRTYSVTVTMGSCTSVAYKNVAVSGVAPSSMNIVGLNTQYYKTDAAVTLVGTPTGGTFRVDNVTRTAFTPANLTVGNHTVTYTITQGICNSVYTKIVRVLAPVVTLQSNNQLDVNSKAGINKTGLDWVNNTDNNENYSMNSDVKTLTFNQLGRVSIFPNPAIEYMDVNLENYIGKAVTMNIYNHFGQIVFTQKLDEVSSLTQNIELTNLHTGNYILRVISPEKRDAVIKFVVSK